MDPSLDWHHAHNLDLLASCYQHKGQVKLAEKTLRESETLQVLSSYRAFAQRELPGFLILRGRYEEALKEARALGESKFVQGRAVGRALAGQALLALGRTGEAQVELDAAKRELDAVPVVGNGVEPTKASVEPWVNALEGEMLLRAGKTKAGEEILKG